MEESIRLDETLKMVSESRQRLSDLIKKINQELKILTPLLEKARTHMYSDEYVDRIIKTIIHKCLKSVISIEGSGLSVAKTVFVAVDDYVDFSSYEEELRSKKEEMNPSEFSDYLQNFEAPLNDFRKFLSSAIKELNDFILSQDTKFIFIFADVEKRSIQFENSSLKIQVTFSINIL